MIPLREAYREILNTATQRFARPPAARPTYLPTEVPRVKLRTSGKNATRCVVAAETVRCEFSFGCFCCASQRCAQLTVMRTAHHDAQ